MVGYYRILCVFSFSFSSFIYSETGKYILLFIYVGTGDYVCYLSWKELCLLKYLNSTFAKDKQVCASSEQPTTSQPQLKARGDGFAFQLCSLQWKQVWKRILHPRERKMLMAESKCRNICAIRWVEMQTWQIYHCNWAMMLSVAVSSHGGFLSVSSSHCWCRPKQLGQIKCTRFRWLQEGNSFWDLVFLPCLPSWPHILLQSCRNVVSDLFPDVWFKVFSFS